MLVEHIASHCLILVKTALVHSKIKFSPYFFLDSSYGVHYIQLSSAIIAYMI
jgi:hypothetical protein